MALHLICLTNTGLPIFNRKFGACENLPFSTIGSLNGVHMFCKNQGVSLNKTRLEDGLIVWREFDDNLLLIAISSSGGVQECNLMYLLELAYNGLIMLIGLNGLQMSQNPERLKRELKHALPMVDKLLLEVDSGLIGFSDCILSNENQILLEKLNEFSEQCGSPYACLMVRNKIAVATEGWWELHAIDRKLLNIMQQTTTALQVDVPVYLPKKSPNIAYRLITVPILQNVNLCVLCGAEPLYMEVQALAQQIYASVLVSLQAVESGYPRNIPIEMDEGILGLLLINRRMRKCVISRNIRESQGDQIKRLASGGHRLDILKTFYNQALDTMEEFLNRRSGTGNKKVLESYWSSDYYKLHAQIQGDNLICVMYVAAIPVHTMRLITRETLKEVLTEKDLCF